MGQNDKKIAELIDSIAHKRGHGLRIPVMTGKVISVDEAEMTATVELSVDKEGVYTAGININVVLQAVEGMYGIPGADSYCLVAEIDGPGKWELLKANKYTKLYGKVGASEVMVKDDVIQLNDGGDGGLVKVAELTGQLNDIEDKLNSLINKWNSFCAAYLPGSASSAGVPATLTTETVTTLVSTSRSDIENTKVKHG
ncbi:MAG: hypothetical protein K0Q79_1498 [Flavipsychrobacter sp.]|jgi:hypothetical protein|nr:hypothetical protein [Flavipsychrobacter sp.]